MWWYWVFISPTIWLCYLKQEQVILILHNIKNKEPIILAGFKQECLCLLKILCAIIVIVFLAIMIFIVTKIFGDLVIKLFNLLLGIIV